MKTLACLVIAILVNSSVLIAQPFSLSGVSDMVRVFGDGYNLPAMHDTIKMFGIRGEIISGQCILISKKNLSDVTVEVGDLKNHITGKQLPATNVEWNFVGSIPLSENARNQPLSAVSRPAPALFPDYLMAEKQISIEKDIYQSIWLTINIPGMASAGTYIGQVTVKSSNGDRSLPVELTIYPLSLPAERHLKIVEWYSTGGFERFHGIKEQYSDDWFNMLKIYADNMVAHRQNTFRVSMSSINILQLENGEFTFDFSLFEKIAMVFWNTGKMDYMETSTLARFGEGKWYSTEIFLREIDVTNSESGEQVSMAGKEVIPYLLPAFESYLRQKGWLDKTLFHIKDEPSTHNAIAYKEMSAYLHKYAPDLRRIDAIETAFVLDEIEIAVPKLDYLETWYDTYREWQLKGNELWFYTVGSFQGSSFPNKTIDMPLMDSRIMHWLNYKYDAVGYLHWGWNRWKDADPYKEPGEHIGGGWHVYPVKEGVLNSLRWEQMRNGIQDYEYFWMLENKIAALKDSLGSRFSWIDPKQRSKEITDGVVMSLLKHTDDPQDIYKAKKEVIKELLDFETSPRIYVQTDPVVNSTLTFRSSIAVYGWTEPGTKIVINGQEIPVSQQGLFLEQFTMSMQQEKITIQATNPNGEKKIIRNFVIQ